MKALSFFINFANKLFEELPSVPPILWLCIFGTWMVLPVPLAFMFNTPEIFSHTFSLAAEFIPTRPIINNMLLYAHIAAAFCSIICGPALFIPKLRNAYPSWHRFLGQIYVIGCLFSAVTVLPLAWNNHPGTVAQYGFTPMATMWFITTYFAYTAAINKNFITHRRWAMRSYGMTLAFVHVNLTFKLVLPIEHMSVDSKVAVMSMLSWLTNLFLVELYLAATSFKGRFLGFGKWLHNLTHYAQEDKFFLNYKKAKPSH